MNGPKSQGGKAWKAPAPLNRDVLKVGEIPSMLSIEEREELTACEEAIRQGLETFLKVGNAMLSIHAKNLFRDTHKTFDEYCRDRWGYQKAYAHRLIAAAKTVQVLSPIGDKTPPSDLVLPTNESQIRPLVNLEPEQMRVVWRSVVKKADHGPITAKLVLEQVKSLRNDGGASPKKTHSGKKEGENSIRILLALTRLEELIAKTSVAEECAVQIGSIKMLLSKML